MPVISIFTFNGLPSVFNVCKSLNGKKFSDAWLTAKESKYNKDEVFIQYYYYEDLEESLRKVFSEEDSYEIVSFLKENGKSKVLKRTYCFINLLTKTLEVYRYPDDKTKEIVSLLEKLLKCEFAPLKLKSEELQKIYSQHATELKQVMFRNVEGLIYDILRANYLEDNVRFKEYLQLFPESLRAISFRPKIKFLNNNNKYQVTINGDKGTIRLSSNEIFQWRPRFEIRQIVFIVANIAGLLQTLNR
jgi:hypothetical protein